jgi:hypothetical protein
MNLLDSVLDVGMVDLIASGGQTVVIGGKSIKAVVSSVQVQDEWMAGGHNASRACSVALRSRDASPKVGDLITADGVNYQILRIDREGPGITLTCSTPVQ